MIQIKVVHDDFDTVYCAPIDEKELLGEGFKVIASSSISDGIAIAINMAKWKEAFAVRFEVF